MNILIVGDNPGDVRLVREILKEAGGEFRISVAETLRCGLDLLTSQHVDAVLLDLGLPDSRGLETLDRIRARLSHLPIVIMTSSADEALGVQAVHLGAQDYLVKGQVDGRLLRRGLTYAIERKRAEEALRKAKDELEERVLEPTAELARANELLERDIAERKRVEETVRIQAERYATMLTTTPDGFWLVDAERKLLDVNEAYCRMSGYTREDLLDMHVSDLEALETPEETDRHIRKVTETGFDLSETRHRKKDGSLADIEIRISSWRAAGRFLVIVREITERKLAETQLKESEKKLRLLSSELMSAQEKERKRVAGELHDSIAASLTAIQFNAERISRQTELDIRIQGELKDLISQVRQVTEETRRIMSDLRPSVLDDLGIIATLDWFCRQFGKTYSHIHVVKQVDLAEGGLTDSLKTAVFRMSQEALNNIAKHSNASLVNIRLQEEHRRIHLTIEDNGQGFDLATVRRGVGLSTMRERTELSGGLFGVESIRGQGTVVHASWPISTSKAG